MKTLIITTIILIFVGCVPKKDHDNVVKENIVLRQEVKNLKLEIEDLKYGAKNLLESAIAYKNGKDYDKAKSVLENLLSKHPLSEYADKAKTMVLEIDQSILKKKKEKEARLANATSKMRKSYDDINEITWYYDKSSPKYADVNSFHIYIGKKENQDPWLRLKIRYTAEDWLFIEKYIIKVDGVIYEINENNYGEIKTDNDGGVIFEWLDRSVEREEYAIINAVANGKDVKIRYSGRDYSNDRVITTSEKTALKNVLAVYEALGGKSL